MRRKTKKGEVVQVNEERKGGQLRQLRRLRRLGQLRGVEEVGRLRRHRDEKLLAERTISWSQCGVVKRLHVKTGIISL